MNQIQAEMAGESLPRRVQLLGINQVGHESGNALACQGRTLPWLQETASHDVWAAWGVTYRDVIILAADNSVFAVYNLTSHDLAVAAHRDELKQLLRDAAAR